MASIISDKRGEDPELKGKVKQVNIFTLKNLRTSPKVFALFFFALKFNI